MEIIQKSNNILKNITPEDQIEKSHLTYGFGDSFLVEKSGKEIKEKLLIILEKEKQEIVEYKIQLESLQTKIGEEPTKSIKDIFPWEVDGHDDLIGELPLMYEWGGEPLKQNEVSYVTDKPVEEVEKLKEEYKSKILKLLGGLKEIKLINTILTSYPDDKKYKLSLREVSMLGF